MKNLLIMLTIFSLSGSLAYGRSITIVNKTNAPYSIYLPFYGSNFPWGDIAPGDTVTHTSNNKHDVLVFENGNNSQSVLLTMDSDYPELPLTSDAVVNIHVCRSLALGSKQEPIYYLQEAKC